MLAEHDQRFRRIVGRYLQRPGGDDGALLHRGCVISPEGADPEAGRVRACACGRGETRSG